jgi:hypothetical protein
MIYYDVETLVNCFTCTAIDDNDNGWVFEISERKNDFHNLINWLDWIRDTGKEMCGFNNLGFDYLVLFYIYSRGLKNAEQIYTVAQRVINAARSGVPYKEPILFKQIDLYKIHHFDNKARLTGLKQIEFAMRMDRVLEMPFPHNVPIATSDIPALLDYNRHDVIATRDFARDSADKIDLRRELSAIYSPAFMNYSDSKLGKQIIIRELKKGGVECYDKNGNARQTPRPDGIPVSHIILDSVQFKSHAFNSILTDYKRLIIRETKGVNLGLDVNVRGVDFSFGFGGIHASVKKKIYRSNDTHIIIDADVTSYYPNMSIRHGFYPAHLGEKFPPVYEGMYDIRAAHKKAKRKKLSEAYKMGLNCVYGESNEPFSPFFDPRMTMGITINGQLFLAMLAERLMWNKEFEIIQANTDGLTFYMPRSMVAEYYAICEQWQKETKLELEFVEYSQMIVRDVNNYIAQSTAGDVKLKGAYNHKVEWHKDHSFLIVPKAASESLLTGKPVADIIRNHPDVFDFLGFLKAKNRTTELMVGREKYHGSVRYVVSKTGDPAFKVMPPVISTSKKAEFLKKQDDMFGKPPPQPRKIGVNVGRKITVVNDINTAIFDIDYDFYINEAEKLVSVFNKAVPDISSQGLD